MPALNLNPNPIMVKEFRSRMRGWRSFAILTAYLVFLAAFSYGIYRFTLMSSGYGYGGMPLSPMIGQALYAALTNLSLFFVAFLMPALTATCISSENEKLTLEMLQSTPLSAHAILVGKLVSSAGYILLLIFAAVPMASLVFMFGGVTATDLLLAAVMIFVTAITFGIIGLFFSAWRKRTVQALVMSYLTILVMVAGTLAVYIFWGVVIQNIPPRYVLLANPFSALGSVLATGNTSINNPMMVFLGVAGFGGFMGDPSAIAELRPLWHYTLVFYSGFSLILYLLAARLIKPIRPWHIGKKGWGLAGLAVIAYLLGSTALFYPDVTREYEILHITPTPFPEPMMMPKDTFAVPVPVQEPESPLPDPTPTPVTNDQ